MRSYRGIKIFQGKVIFFLFIPSAILVKEKKIQSKYENLTKVNCRNNFIDTLYFFSKASMERLRDCQENISTNNRQVPRIFGCHFNLNFIGGQGGGGGVGG